MNEKTVIATLLAAIGSACTSAAVAMGNGAQDTNTAAAAAAVGKGKGKKGAAPPAEDPLGESLPGDDPLGEGLPTDGLGDGLGDGLDDGLGGTTKAPTVEDVRLALCALRDRDGNSVRSSAVMAKFIADPNKAATMNNIPVTQYAALIDFATKLPAAKKK